MDYRSVLLIGMLSGAALLAASCSAADPQTVNFSERPRGQTGDLTSGGPGAEGGVDGGSSGSSGEAGTDGGSSGAPITAFTGAAAYNAAGTADTSQNAAHPNGGNPAGVNCMDCHGPAGPANAKWGVAGTVYSSTAGTAIVAKAEIRVVNAAGKEIALTSSDALGNFWADAIVGGLPGGAKVGVRNATVTKLMTTALTTQDSGCQKAGCHVTGAGMQGRIYLQ
jgi:mono/diheme cytochrome c family protein